MIKEIVEALVDAKIERADMSVALYRVAAHVGRPTLIKGSISGRGKPLRQCFGTERHTSSRSMRTHVLARSSSGGTSRNRQNSTLTHGPAV
jgi:hypothetical protein